MIAALFVATNGVYFGLPNIDPWDEFRDARDYCGVHPIIAHPPCERWGRYWSGGPSAKVKRELGDDNGCFESAVHNVRLFGGIIEHPEASHAFKHFGLPIPKFNGGWTDPDVYGGRSCCVAQGHYGHPAQKMTWLYAIINEYPELRWGRCSNKIRADEGFKTSEERRQKRIQGQKPIKRLSKKQLVHTPIEFRDLLISLVSK